MRIFKSLERGGNITPDLLEGIGRAYVRLGATEEAIDYFRRAIEANPNLLSSKVNLGISLIDRGEFEEGAEFLMEALNGGKQAGKLDQKTRDRLVAEHVKLGEIYVELGFSMEAIQEYKRAIRIGGDYPDIRRKMAKEYIQINLLTDAERELKKALQRNPFYEEARADLGFLYMLKGKADLAAEEWVQVESGGRGGGLIMAYRGGGGRNVPEGDPVRIGSPDWPGEPVNEE